MVKKKILIIGPLPPPYHGMTTVTNTILNSFLNKDYKLIHVNTSDRRPVSKMGLFDIINIWLAFKHFFIFLWICFKEKPNMVYLPIAQNIAGYLRDSLFLVPCRILDIKTVIHLNGGYFRVFYEKSNILMKVLIKYTLEKVSAAIVLGNCLKYIFKGIIPEGKIFVVPNGVEDNFKNNTKKYFQSNTCQILFLGNLCRSKGVFEILKIIPIITSKCKNVKFIFAGDWMKEDEKKEAIEFIDRHNINSYVEFIGVIYGEIKKKYLLNSDLLLFPTDYPFEGQPFVILEAMSAGLPIISTNKGAIGETIIDGENGYLIGIGDTEQLVKKITELISNIDLRKKMGQRSREIYLERFTKERFIQNLSNVFDTVLKD